ATDVEAGADLAGGVANRERRLREVDVPTAPTRQDLSRVGQDPILALELGECVLAAVATINVEHDAPVGRCCDVRARRSRYPPTANSCLIGRCVLKTARCTTRDRMLPGALTVVRVTGTSAVDDPPHGKDGNAMARILQGCVEHHSARSNRPRGHAR